MKTESTRISGRRRRIQSSKSQPNPLFSAVSGDLQEVLLISGEEEADLLENFYTTRRVHSAPPHERKALIDVMPEDIKELVGNAEQSALDVVELDILDFALNYDRNRLLSIIGPKGTGKSTLLKYLFRTLRKKAGLPSLTKLVPIFIDALSCGTKKPSFKDIGFRIDASLRELGYSEYLDNTSRRYQYSSDIVGVIKNLPLSDDCRAVVILDNLDILHPKYCAILRDLGRALFLESGATVIDSMRPSTYRTVYDLSAERGSIARYRVTITPPDLKEVIRRRLEPIFGTRNRQISLETGQNTVVVQNARECLLSINELVLTENTQKMLYGLSNSNIRIALLLFERFFRFHDLDYRGLLASTFPNERRFRSGDFWSYHVFHGVVHGEDEIYHSNSRTEIPNFYVHRSSGEPHYCLIFRILSALDFFDRLVDLAEFVKLVQAYGYDHDTVKEAVSFLLRRQAIYSPEHDEELSEARSFSLSGLGRYYLKNMFSNEDYLYDVVFDIDLPHQIASGKNNFEERMGSIFEYLKLVLTIEREQIELAASSRFAAKAIGSMRHSGLLSRRVFECAHTLANRTLRAHSAKGDGSRRAANDSENFLDLLREPLEQLEHQLSSELQRRSLEADEISHPTTQLTVPGLGELTVNYPRVLDPTRQNIIRIDLDLEEAGSYDELIAFVRVGGTIAPLTFRQSGDHEYIGETLLDAGEEVAPLKPFTTQIYSKTKPLLWHKFQ